MTIKGLGKMLKDKWPHLYKAALLTSFEGRKIAVDAPLITLHSYMAVARKQVVYATNILVDEPSYDDMIKIWLEKTCDLIAMWMSYGVTLLFVFDGKRLPEKEAIARKKRDIERQKKEDNLARLRLIKPLEHNDQTKEELRKALSAVYPSGERELEILKKLLDALGVPWMVATHDAEKLCVMLCIDGIVDAVYSSDLDCLAYNCPLLITDMAPKSYDKVKKESVHAVIIISAADVLAALKLEHKVFIDFCITLGTDYNENISKIGPVKGYDMIIRHGSIDNYTVDKTILNHVRGREILGYTAWPLVTTVGKPNNCTGPDTTKLQALGLSHHNNRFVHLFNKLPIPIISIISSVTEKIETEFIIEE